MIRLEKILCPIDFSDSSKHALVYARALAEQFGAQLHLIHVVEPVYVPVDFGAPGIVPYDPESGERLAALLHNLIDEETRRKLRVAERVLEGAAFAEIVRYARSEEIDLITIGTHGLSGIAHLLIGSTAEKVVRKSPCPVLTVKHPEREFVMP